MSHLVSPTSYRIGRTALWGNTGAQVIESLVWRSWLAYPVGFTRSSALAIGQKAYLLYYPVLSIYRYRRRFLYPRFYRRLSSLAWFSSPTAQQAELLMRSFWLRASYRFLKRFTIRRRAQGWQDWFRVAMMRGAGALTGLKGGLLASLALVPGLGRASQLTSLSRLAISRVMWGVTSYKKDTERTSSLKLIASAVYAEKLVGPAWLQRLRHESTAATEQASLGAASRIKPRAGHGAVQQPSGSAYRLSNQLMTAIVSHGLRTPVRIKAINVFQYLLDKSIMLPDAYLSHISELSSPKTRRDQHTYKEYYDILNLIYLQSRLVNTEWLLLRIIKYALFKLHRRNIKMRYFLRFVHNIMKSFSKVGRDVVVFRLVVHGKIKGGTHRTGVFTAGYGKPALNTIGVSTKYCFDNIYSKYGEFGMHLIVSRRLFPALDDTAL